MVASDAEFSMIWNIIGDVPLPIIIEDDDWLF
jgi:hypothetical protein